MVIVRLNGGLGNQMFQYALGKQLAVLHNTELKLDTRWFDKGIRNYELKYFHIEENIASEAEIACAKKMTTSFLNRLQRNVIEPVLPYYRRSHLKEQNTSFDANIFKSKKDVYLEGYWQTEKYFSRIKDTIFKAFTSKYTLDTGNLQISSSISACNAVSVHIRRGDYVSNPEYASMYGACDIDYYKRACTLINKQLVNPYYFIFSDDPEWTKAHIDFFQPSLLISHNTGEHSYKDLLLMSLCKHNIIANSSFSWWAAWLNVNPNKIVIAPERWFNNKSLANQDILPDSWHKI